MDSDVKNTKRGRRGGRATVAPEILARVHTRVCMGVPIAKACREAGICSNTYHRWIKLQDFRTQLKECVEIIKEMENGTE